MFFNLGGEKLFVIALVILLLFGPKKLAEFSKLAGKILTNLNKSLKDIQDEIKNSIDKK